MTKRKVTDLLPSEAILISCDEDLKVLKEFEKAGITWIDGALATSFNPLSFSGEENVIIHIELERIVWAYTEGSGLTIYPATDFIPTETDEVEVDKFWKKLSEEKPNSYQTGHWDGKMSDEILFADKDGYFYIGKCYQGIIDGSEFCCFYDQNDFDVANVTHWAKIPSLF